MSNRKSKKSSRPIDIQSNQESMYLQLVERENALSGFDPETNTYDPDYDENRVRTEDEFEIEHDYDDRVSEYPTGDPNYDEKHPTGYDNQHMIEYEDFQAMNEQLEMRNLPNAQFFNMIPCQHTNVLWLCQECEIEIRQQDIIDRIEIVMDKQRYINHNYEYIASTYTMRPYANYSIAITSKSGIFGLDDFTAEFSGAFIEPYNQWLVVS
jgi:hypothetical protein